MKEYECCICGGKFNDYGNNPWPIVGERCCDTCNSKLVIPVRFAMAGLRKNAVDMIEEIEKEP